ncbi:unnamed protein product [Schistosoma haematobium]|nr:unnamed protein product [Schistosoma haematobium]
MKLCKLKEWNTRLVQLPHHTKLSELADIGDEINGRFSYPLDSLSSSNELAVMKTFSNSPGTFQHSDYLSCKIGFNSKGEAIRLFYYATPVLVIAYLFYRRIS